MIEALIAEPGIDWRRVVTAFHMDEYIGLPADAPQRFAVWLRERLFGRLTKASASAQAHGGGGEIAGYYRRGPVGLVHAQNFRVFLKGKAHLMVAVRSGLTPPDCRAPLRHDKVVDGSDALPDENAQERKHRNGAARSSLQHEAGDTDSGC
jgi:hypothetical protein